MPFQTCSLWSFPLSLPSKHLSLFIPQTLLLMLLRLSKKVLVWLLPELPGNAHEYHLLAFQA